MKRLLYLGSASYLLIGLAHVIVASLMSALLLHYGKSYTDGGMLVFLQFSGFLCGVLTSPIWTRLAGRRKPLFLAALCLAAAQTGYFLLPGWNLMLALGFMAGLGFGIIETVIGSLMIDAARRQRAVIMSRLEVFFGLGAMSMPLLAGLLLATDYWRFSFLVLGLYALVTATGWGVLSFGRQNRLLSREAVRTTPGKHKGAPPLSRHAVLLLFVSFFLVYVGLEMSIANFIPAILIETFAFENALTPLSVTCFWTAMTVGRIFAGHLAERFGYFRYVFFCCLASLVILLFLFLANHAVIAFVWIFVLGLMMSGLFSVALVWGNTAIGGQTERNTSLMIAAGGVGGAIFPLLTGWSMDRFGSGYAALGLFLVLSLSLCVLSLWVQRRCQPKNLPACTE